MEVRVSIGSAAVLGLTRCRLGANPTTAYLMLHSEDGCSANCVFCPQARDARSRRDMLSRVVWPTFELGEVVSPLGMRRQAFNRICVQCVLYPGFLGELLTVVETLASCGPPVSVSCPPLAEGDFRRLRLSGVDRVSIPVDGATEEIFDSVKGAGAGGPYRWRRHLEALAHALGVFGRGRVGTHLIVGLGESEEEAVGFIQRMKQLGVYVALFAFTPIRGTNMEMAKRPSPESYHRIQLAHHLIESGSSRADLMEFDGEGRVVGFGLDPETLWEAASSGEPFMTKGCPGCNRPFYNEAPGGPMYNYPYRPGKEETSEILKQLAIWP